MKKLLLLPLLFLLVSTSQAQNDHLISYQFLQHYTTADVETILASFGIPQGALEVEYELDYYKVTYVTDNALGNDTTIATGAIVVPTGMTCPVPIISYQHGTTSERYEVPSYQDGGEYQVGIIAAALSGSVVTMPDYIGLGDSPGFHPYINARTEASATIDLLRTCRELKDSLPYELNDQLLLFGYSQGGHSTMATFKEIETNLQNEFTVTACAPMSGPYNVSGVQANTIIADTPYATPGYLPYVVMGQQEAYGNVYNSLSEIFKPPYDSLLPIYFDGTHGMGWINDRLPDTPNVMLDSAYFNNFKNDPNHFAWGLLRDNDLHNWSPTAPLVMYYCTGDEQVFYQNSIVAEDTMLALGASNAYAVGYGNLSHADCAPICFLQGFAFFEMYSDYTGGMQVSDNTTDASSSNDDGSITVNVNSGVGPYSYQWQGGVAGETTQTISGLASNSYEVKITDSRGCYITHNTTVGMASNVHNVAQQTFKILPNPARDRFLVKMTQLLDEPFSITILDLQGKVIHEVPKTQQLVTPFDVQQLPNGMYLVQIKHKDKTYTQQLRVQK